MNTLDLIRDFGARAGMPGFALDDRGMARMELDGAVIVDFELDEDHDMLHVFSVIGPAPARDAEAALRSMLALNLFLNDSAGATLALDEVAAEFIACRRLEQPALETMDGITLLRIVEALADTVERAREALALPAQEHRPPGGASGLQPAFLRG